MSRLRGLKFAAALAISSVSPAAAAAEPSRPQIIASASPSVARIVAKPKSEPPPPPLKGQRDPALNELMQRFGASRNKNEEGSGFVVDQAAGLVLTAAHILAKAHEVTVQFPGSAPLPAVVAGIDEESGIGVLRVAGPLPPALDLAERPLVAGEAATIVGWMIPAGSVLALEGMVMGDLPAIADEPTAPPLARYTAIDAVIPNGGFGGSPVLDSSGKTMGFVSAIYGRGYGPGTLTMIIPAQGLRAIIDELSHKGRVQRGEIGITTECRAGGCLVLAVDEGGPAASAGIVERDRIVSIDGVEMETDAAIRRAIAAKPAGSRVLMGMARGDRPYLVGVATSVSNQN